MINKIVIGILFAIVIACTAITYTQAACTQADLNAQVNIINALVTDLKDPSKTISDASIKAKIDAAVAVGDECKAVMMSMVDKTKILQETIETSRCFASNTTSLEYIQDPCCNPRLFETTCCRSRDVLLQRTKLDTFKDKATWTGCAPTSAEDETKVRGLARHYVRRLQDLARQCEHTNNYEKHFLIRLEESVKECKTSIFETNKRCYADAECDSGRCIPNSNTDSQTYFCAPASVDITNGGDQALAKCLLRTLPEENIRFLQDALSQGTSETLSLDALTTALATEVGKESCVEEKYDTTTNKWVSQTVPQGTKSACEAVTECNDGSGSSTCGNNNNFCGAFCDNHVKKLAAADQNKGICAATTAYTTEAECNAVTNNIGTCQNDNEYHATTSQSTLIDQANCVDNKWCSLRCSTHPCGEVECQENTHLCHGVPNIFRDSNGRARARCLVPHNTTTTSPWEPKCKAGETDVGFACVTADDSSSACATNNRFDDWQKAEYLRVFKKEMPYPKWEKVPATLSDCTLIAQDPDTVGTQILYRKCKMPNGITTLRGEHECARCGGVVDTLYQTQSGVHRQGLWTKRTAWMARATVQKYRWTSTLDTTKFDNLVARLMKTVTAYANERHVACATSPLFDNLKQFTCGCEGGSNCYAENPRPIGSFIAFPGAQDHIIMNEVEVIVDRESIASDVTNGQQQITVSSVQLAYDDGSTIQALETPRKLIYNDAGEAVGQIVGNAVKLDVVVPNGVTICTKVDRQANISIFTGAKFATYADGKYTVDSSVSNPISTKSNMVCGKVKNQNLYYPALIDVRRFRPTSAAGKVAASGVIISIVSIIAMIIAA